jgi:hypothetical protein
MLLVTIFARRPPSSVEVEELKATHLTQCWAIFNTEQSVKLPVQFDYSLSNPVFFSPLPLMLSLMILSKHSGFGIYSLHLRV